VREFLFDVSVLSVQIFAVASMVSVGLSHSLGEILGPLGDLWGDFLSRRRRSNHRVCS
jgi:hypothetical protein